LSEHYLNSSRVYLPSTCSIPLMTVRRISRTSGPSSSSSAVGGRSPYNTDLLSRLHNGDEVGIRGMNGGGVGTRASDAHRGSMDPDGILSLCSATPGFAPRCTTTSPETDISSSAHECAGKNGGGVGMRAVKAQLGSLNLGESLSMGCEIPINIFNVTVLCADSRNSMNSHLCPYPDPHPSGWPYQPRHPRMGERMEGVSGREQPRPNWGAYGLARDTDWDGRFLSKYSITRSYTRLIRQ
jgi:hypothetical protein